MRILIANTRYKIIPLLLGCLCVSAMFCGYQILKPSDNNVAHAAISNPIYPSPGNYSVFEKRALKIRLKSDQNNVLELSAQDVVEVFDVPELIRREAPVTVWQYRNHVCVLDVYFKILKSRDPEDTKVAHYELRPRTSKQALSDDETKLCFREMVDGKFQAALFNVKHAFKANEL